MSSTGFGRDTVQAVQPATIDGLGRKIQFACFVLTEGQHGHADGWNPEVLLHVSRLCVQFQCPDLRSEEPTSELQSLVNIVCRLLLEKKKNNIKNRIHPPGFVS